MRGVRTVVRSVNRWPLVKDLSNHLGIRHGGSVRRSARDRPSLGRPRVAWRFGALASWTSTSGSLSLDLGRGSPFRVVFTAGTPAARLRAVRRGRVGASSFGDIPCRPRAVWLPLALNR